MEPQQQGGGGGGASSWKEEVIQAIINRNKQQVEPFAKLIDTFTLIHRQGQRLREHNEYQEKELLILRHEATAEPKGAESRDTTVAKLQRKVQQLQEELTDKFRRDVQGATSQLGLTRENQELFKKLQDTRTESEQISADLEQSRSREVAFSTENAQLKSDLDIVQKELVRLRALLEQAEKELLEARRAHDDLLDRIVAEKSRNAEEMNNMNAMIEELKATLRAQGLPTPRAKVSKEGGGGGPFAEDGSGHGSSLSLVPSECVISFRAHGDKDVNDVQFDEGGVHMVTSGNDGLVRVWDTGSGQLSHTLRGQEAALGIDYRADYVVAGNADNTCKIWHIKTEKVYRNFVGHSGNVYAAHFFPDGRSVVTGSADRTLRIWDVGRAVVSKTMRSGSTCNGLDVSVDGRVAVSAHQDGVIRIWDLRTGNATTLIRDLFTTQATSVLFGHDFKMLSNSRDNCIKIIDSRTYETLQTLRHPEYRTPANWSRACFSPVGGLVAAGSGDGSVLVWEIESGEVKATLKGHEGPVMNCWWGMTPNGPRLASGDKKGNVRLWC